MLCVGNEVCDVSDSIRMRLVSTCLFPLIHLKYDLVLSVHYVKHSGAILDSGTVIARLELDDPSRIRQVGGHVPVPYGTQRKLLSLSRPKRLKGNFLLHSKNLLQSMLA